MNDDRIMNVPEELRKLMREFGDLCFDDAPQEEQQVAWHRYMRVKKLHKEGIEYVPKF